MTPTDHAGAALPVVVRGQGVTAAERYLQRLCDRSFLSLWSYPTPFRDQKVGGKGDGKELCDLLVVFGNDILVFSDKSCAFPDSGDIKLDWSRWFRRAVIKAAEQGWGAERWLRAQPDRIFLDRACTQPFPLHLPAADRMRVHQIVVAHNIAERCKAHFRGGSGTLIFNSDLQGKNQHAEPASCRPFEVGWLDGSSFVHVLDDASVEALLGNRDTITDLVEYLRAKEYFLRALKHRGARMFCTGEEELLAEYLITTVENRHTFDFPADTDVIFLQEGGWERFQRSERRAAQKAADQISYLWDEIIEKFNRNILDGTAYLATPHSIADRERIMRFFAAEPRAQRRFLAERLFEAVWKCKPKERFTRVIPPVSSGGPYYCFLVLPNIYNSPQENYRRIRFNFLEALCRVTKVVYPDALDIVGFATEPGSETSRSEDSAYLDARTWDAESEADARKLQVEFNLLTSLKTHKSRLSEFPVEEGFAPPEPNPRNKPCTCGSGKKWKHCHGNDRNS